MKKGKLKKILVCMCLALVMPNIYATDLVVGNIPLSFEADKDFIFQNNRYYITIHKLGFITEASYRWNSEQNSFDITWRQKQVIIYPNCNYVLCNNKKIFINAKPFWKDEKLYVPISIVRDIFEGSVSYDKNKDILSVEVQTKEFRSKVENPFNKINGIDEVDEIRIDEFDQNIKDTSKISKLMRPLLENSYTKVESGDKRSILYDYYMDLYSKGEFLIRVFVIDSNMIRLSGDWGIYILEKPLERPEAIPQQFVNESFTVEIIKNCITNHTSCVNDFVS